MKGSGMGQESTTTTTEGQAPTEGQEPNAGAGAGTDGAGAGTAAEGQETFSAEYVKGLREEAAKHRTDAKAAADKLKEREDAELSEAEKAKKEKKESDERADKAEAKLLRAEVAEKKKLTASMAARLVGDTKDELEKDADKLLKDLGSGATGGGGFDQGAGRGATPKGGRDWLGKAIAGE
jgi:hypothetical protein